MRAQRCLTCQIGRATSLSTSLLLENFWKHKIIYRKIISGKNKFFPAGKNIFESGFLNFYHKVIFYSSLFTIRTFIRLAFDTGTNLWGWFKDAGIPPLAHLLRGIGKSISIRVPENQWANTGVFVMIYNLYPSLKALCAFKGTSPTLGPLSLWDVIRW